MIIAGSGVVDGEDAAALAVRLASLKAAGACSFLLFAGESCPILEGDWNLLLRALDMPVAGGIFPQVLCGEVLSDTAVLVIGLQCSFEANLIPRLAETDLRTMRDLPCTVEGCPCVMVWFDGLAANISSLIEAIYDRLGPAPVFMGGGAGSLARPGLACVFSNSGALRDAAVVVGLPERLGVGARHGWRQHSGPYLVSEARGHEIHTLDYRPAAQVYLEQLRPMLGDLPEARFCFEYSKSFPFGIERLDGSFLVRDPIRQEGNSLICVGDVPAQASLHILHGERDDLVGALINAWHSALQELGGSRPGAALLVDCLSSGLYSGARYPEHLHELLLRIREQVGNIPLFGVLSLGEIGSAQGLCLELHNKTSVIGLWRDERS